VIDLDALDASGFATVELLDRGEVATLREHLATLSVDRDDPYWASSVHAPRADSCAVDRLLKDTMTDRIGARLADQRPFMAAFISKGCGGGDVGLHPDWTYVDEREHRARVFWCALQDIDEANGAMVVVPGSHRTMRGLRGSGAFPSAVSEVEDALWASEVVTVPLHAGEAVVWDSALLHGSWPNTTAEPRAAAAIGMVPATAPLVHFHLEAATPLAGYAVDEHWFVGEEYATRPTGYPAVEPWDGPLRPYASVDEVVPALQA
jgi:hypothetical protein